MSRPWWRMNAVDPGEFAMLRVDDAADVLWKLCCAHGDAFGIVRALEARRAREVDATLNAILADIDSAASSGGTENT